MRSNFSVSPSSNRPAGIPVQVATTSAMSSAVTSSLTIVASRAFVSAVTFINSSWKVGSSEYRILDACSKSPSRCALSATARRSSIKTLISPMRSRPCFSASHRVRNPRSSSSLSAISARIFSRRSFEGSSFSFATASSSMRNRSTWRWSTSISTGEESISMRSRLADSSIRSIALSGRKRLVM